MSLFWCLYKVILGVYIAVFYFILLIGLKAYVDADDPPLQTDY